MANVDTSGFEAQIQQVLGDNLYDLTDEQKSQLSRVLFPETDVAPVVFMGVERKLRPLTVKYTRRIHQSMMLFAKRVSDGVDTSKVVSVDDELRQSLIEFAKVLCEFYGWGDEVLKKLEEEDVVVDDLQALAVVQSGVNGNNDFLLGPLRMAIQVMQVREVIMLRLKTPISSSTQPS